MKQHRMEILNLLISTQLTQNLPTGLETATVSSLSKIIKSRNSKLRNNNHSSTKITNKFIRSQQTQQNKVEIEDDRVTSMKDTNHSLKDNSYTFSKNKEIMEQLVDQFFEFGINETTKKTLLINNKNKCKQNKQQQQLYHKTSTVMENFYMTSETISPSTIILNLTQQLVNQKLFREEGSMWRQIIGSQNVYQIGYLLAAYGLKTLQSQFGQYFDMREQEHIDSWSIRFRIFMLGEQYRQLFIQNLFNSHYKCRQQFFDIVHQYFQLFNRRAINYSQLVQFSHKLNTFISDCSICDPYLQGFLLIVNPFSSKLNIKTHLNGLLESGNQNTTIQFLLLTTLYWLTLGYESSDPQTLNWMQSRIDDFIALRFQYSQYYQQKPKEDLEQMRTPQLLAMMISKPIDIHAKSIENIILSMILSTETFHALYLRLNISYMKNSTVENKLISNLTQNSKQFTLHRYILGFLPFIEDQENQIPLLLSSQTFIQNIDWHYLSAVIRSKPHFEHLFEETIMGSAKLYRNAEKFINMKLKIQLKPQYFQVNLLIEGLTQILIGGNKLNEAEKSNYFGVITMFREQSIPISIYNNFCLLEMLFEWFILKQALINRDIKSVGISLNFNLEQPNQTHYNTNFSVKLTSSQQFQNPQLHNPKFIQKIWTKDFIGWTINEHINYAWNLVVGFIYSLSEGILLVKRTNQKIVRRHKIEKWIDCLAVKLSLIQRFANIHNKDRFSSHRKTILNQIQA